MRIFLWQYEALFLVFSVRSTMSLRAENREPQKILVLLGHMVAFYDERKTAGYPAVSYFLVTSSKGAPAGYCILVGLIVEKNNPSVDGWCFIFRVFA